MSLRPQAGTAILFATVCMLVMHALASPMKRETFELELTQTVPETVQDMEEFHWKYTVTNKGKEPVIVLLSPDSVLYHKPLKIYEFKPSSGSKEPKYDGWMLKFVDKDYLKAMKGAVEEAGKGKKAKGAAGKSKELVVLKPGEEHSVTHELETAWDFTHSGEGSYKAELKKSATYVWVYDGAEPSTAKRVKLSISGKSEHTVKISGELKNEKKLIVNTLKRNTKRDAPDSKFDSNCDDAMKKTINGALSHANDLVKDTTKFLKGMDLTKKYDSSKKVQERFGYWFADWSTKDAHKTVLEVFEDKLSKLDYEKDFHFNCEDYQEKQYGAAIPSDKDLTIYPGALFFDSACKNTGQDSRAGTLIHEATHFNAVKGTDDQDDPDNSSIPCYGQDCCHRLALKDQDKALDNADNYEYMAENDPKRPEN